MADNTLTFHARIQDDVTKGLLKIGTAFDKVGGKGSSASLFGNVGAKAVAGGFNLVDRAASSVVGVLGDAVQAAMADQESQNRLLASLKANVPAFDGNTAAIEANIKAAQRLGFDDETLRDSLTVLAGATHDVGKAQAIMSTAMDLSRFKGISLRDASEALIKVEGGHYRSLVQLGIKLKDGATQQDALNAVQAVAQGQAEAYANTVSGELVAAQVGFNEEIEKLGYALLPTVRDVLKEVNKGLADFDKGVGPAAEVIKTFDDMGKQLDAIGNASNDAGQAVNQFFLGPKGVIPLAQASDAALDGQRNRVVNLARSLDGPLYSAVVKNADNLIAYREELDRVSGAAVDLKTGYSAAIDSMVSKTGDLIDNAFTPIISWNTKLLNDTKITNAQRVLDNKQSSQAERQQARIDIAQNESDNAHLLLTMASRGQLTHHQIGAAMDDLRDQIKRAKGPAKAALQEVLDKLLQIESKKNLEIKIRVHGFSSLKNLGGIGARASGGPVSPGEAYTVGEQGPEMLVMGNRGGTVVPNGGTTGGTTVIVNYSPMMSTAGTAEARQLARAIIPELTREMRRQRLS